ncbi:MAG: CAP domain-containing protein, partial [Steroidobacteraceae bacterium]
ALRRALAQDLCTELTDRNFRDVGGAARGDDIWIVLAAPFTPPSEPSAALAATVLAQINAARAVARRCGTRLFPAAPPLRLNALLTRAAAAHARDMLEHDYFSHTGSDGSTPGHRIMRAGYRYHLAGENIAFGQQDATQAVQAWLESPGHCANIMDRGFRDMGVAYISNTRGAPRIYWVQDFGAPRAPAAR